MQVYVANRRSSVWHVGDADITMRWKRFERKAIKSGGVQKAGRWRGRAMAQRGVELKL